VPAPRSRSATNADDTGTIRFLAGVDEAGLGPVLGPLVVAGVTMSGPHGVDPWQALAPTVCRSRPLRAQLMVADSKKVKQGRYGLERLERTVLAWWQALHGEIPEHLADLLRAQGADLDRLELPLPLFGPRDAIEASAADLAAQLAATDVAIHRMVMRPLDVEEFNQSIQDTDNKSTTHFRCYAEVLGRLLDDLPDDAHLLADRAGGRMHYRSALREALPQGEDWRIEVLRETRGLSTYRLHRQGGSSLRLTFAAGGEDRAFPTALASCCAKYLRECLMTILNRWFAQRIPGLRPTAGYYVDGLRFLADVDELVSRMSLPRERLRRSR
jgi:hypothetical protein